MPQVHSVTVEHQTRLGAESTQTQGTELWQGTVQASPALGGREEVQEMEENKWQLSGGQREGLQVGSVKLLGSS